MKSLKKLWWLCSPHKPTIRIEVYRGSRILEGTFRDLGGDFPKFYPKDGSTCHILRKNRTTDERAYWRYVKDELMSNNFIVNSTIDMMDAPDMTEKWVPISKNTFQFADIKVDPEGIIFDNQRFKMSFMQRMKFLRAFGLLQEYYAVKKFRDSIQGALECSPAQSKLAAS